MLLILVDLLVGIVTIIIPGKKKRRSFLKTSVSFDTTKLIVTGFKISGKPVLMQSMR